MTVRAALNVDAGGSFGPWTLEGGAAVFPDVCCGVRAGDSLTGRRAPDLYARVRCNPRLRPGDAVRGTGAQPDTLCIHNGSPNAPALARAVLEVSGVESASLPVPEPA